MRNILGVDPGLSGCLSLYDGKELLLWDTPTFELIVNGKKRRRLDIVRLQSILREYHIHHAFIERVNAQPGNGIAAAFAYGYGVGATDAVIQCCGIPFTHVTPQKWKKVMECPKEKDEARHRASQLAPQFAHNWERKKDDGRAESFLIALYGFNHQSHCGGLRE